MLFRSSNPEEFERLALRHTESLLRAARRLTPPHAAEDLVQETLLKAWRSFAHFDPSTDCKAWLFRIMLNESSRFRARRRHLAENASPLDEEFFAWTAEERERYTSWEIEAALGQLPEEQRIVILLAAVEGFTCKEIADILGVPIGTVMSRLSRARARLREILAPGDRPQSKSERVRNGM